MDKKKAILYFLILVFIFSFCWELFFTYGFNFFWEDFDYFYLHKAKNLLTLKPLLPETMLSFLKESVVPHRFFQVRFSTSLYDRPYEHLTADLLSIVFGDKVVFYRIFKSLILATYVLLSFLIISKASILLGLLAALLYIGSGEIWSLSVIACDVGLYAQLAVLLSVIIFLRLLEKAQKKPLNLWPSYILILLISQYAVLAKNDGRYLAVIFFLTLLFFRRDQLRFHLPMLSVLFFFEVPVLGYLKKIFIKTPFYPINIASHNSRALDQSLSSIVKNYAFPMAAIGKLILALLCIIFLIHIFHLLFFRTRVNLANKDHSLLILKERAFLFFLLFLVNFIMMAIARSFDYDYIYSIGLVDCSFFIMPFLIFLCYYIAIVRRYMTGLSIKVLIVVCAILITGELFLFKIPRLIRFRGGWGSYFCAWANTERYIDSVSKKALVLSINQMQYLPFVFRNSSNEIIMTNLPAENSPFSNLEFIEKKFKEGGYSDIFVVQFSPDNEIIFQGKSNLIKLEAKTTIDGNCNDFYDQLRCRLGKASPPAVKVFHFKVK